MNSALSNRSTPIDFLAGKARCRWRVVVCVLLVAFLFDAGGAHASSRIKDIADFEGVRDNLLVGYGLVVGLNGTGIR